MKALVTGGGGLALLAAGLLLVDTVGTPLLSDMAGRGPLTDHPQNGHFALSPFDSLFPFVGQADVFDEVVLVRSAHALLYGSHL